MTTSEQQAVPVAQEKAYRFAGEVSNDATSHLAIRSPLNRVIYKAVRDYRLSNMAYADDEGSAYPLVDLMSNPAPSDIGTGEMEMISLVDEIQIAIEAAGLSVPLPCKSGEGAGEIAGDGFKFATKAGDPFGQPHIEATKLALTATPETFPRDSYGLARWLDLALFTAVPAAYETGSENDLAAYIRDWCPDHVRDYVAALTPDATQTREAEGQAFLDAFDAAQEDGGHILWKAATDAADTYRAALNARGGA